jgi:hypothetical protein
LTLPAGFCATVFADGIGHARHLVAAPDGSLYVNTWSGDYYDFDKVHEGGFLVALQDKSGAGKAGTIDRIVRYVIPAGALLPQVPPETIVSGLPLGGDHPMHPFIIGEDGSSAPTCWKAG